MKGSDLILRILIILAMSLFLLAGILNEADSLSGLHLTDFDLILYSGLLAIILVKWTASFMIQEKDKELTKIFKIPINLGQALRYNAAFYCGVLILGVNNDGYYLLHLAFTAISISTGYIIMLLYPDKKIHRHISYVVLAYGLVSFGLGFWLHLYSVTWAEFLVAIPEAIFAYILIRKKLK